MSKTVSLKINARDGSVELKCSENFFETAMEQCIEVISAFNEFPEVKTQFSKPLSKKSESIVDHTEVPIKDADKPIEKAKPQRQRSSGGEAPNYSEVNLGLTDNQCRELRQFYEEKSPSKQNDIVAVVTVKIADLIDKKEFSVDEIFSGVRLIGGVKTPRSIKAVINNMYSLGLAGRTDGKLVVNFATEDHVNLQLPAQTETQ